MKASLSKVLTGIVLGLVITGNAVPAINAQTKEAPNNSLEELKETKSTEAKEEYDRDLKETKSTEAKEEYDRDLKETKSTEAKDKSKDETQKSNKKQKDLFEVADLPRPIINVIIVTAFIITMVATLTGTGQSIKYEKQNHSQKGH